MDKEFLIKRLQDIEQAIQNAILQHHAGLGARAEILNLLKNVGENMATSVADEVLRDAIPASNPEETESQSTLPTDA